MLVSGCWQSYFWYILEYSVAVFNGLSELSLGDFAMLTEKEEGFTCVGIPERQVCALSQNGVN